MAQAFGEPRASLTCEARAEGIAADLAGGQPPEQERIKPPSAAPA
jgi:hypothetical protein